MRVHQNVKPGACLSEDYPKLSYAWTSKLSHVQMGVKAQGTMNTVHSICSRYNEVILTVEWINYLLASQSALFYPRPVLWCCPKSFMPRLELVHGIKSKSAWTLQIHKQEQLKNWAERWHRMPKRAKLHSSKSLLVQSNELKLNRTGKMPKRTMKCAAVTNQMWWWKVYNFFGFQNIKTWRKS